MGAGLQGVPGHWLGAGKASSDLTLPLPLTQSFLARGHATSCPYKMGIPATQRIPSMGQQGAMWGDHQQTGAAGAKEWPLLQASGQCLGRRTDKDNRAGTAALAEGLVFQAQQRPLSSSSGPQRGGTQEVAGSVQSPVCGDPEGISGCGQHWAPGSSVLLAPHPTFPPSSFFPSHERPEEAEAPKDRKGGGVAHEKAMAMGSYQSASTPSSKPNRAS